MTKEKQAFWLDGDKMNFIESVLYILGFTIAVFGGCFVVKEILKKFEIEEEEKGFKGAGKTIGMIERAMVTIFIYSGEFNAIVLIFGVKSIARFSELQDRKFGEYYLIGTLSSLLFAIIIGIIIKWVISNFWYLYS